MRALGDILHDFHTGLEKVCEARLRARAGREGQEATMLLARIKVVPAGEVPEGAGARVRRLMPSPRLPHLDPFVLFDHAAVEPPAGFPDHPHRGFEIVTYMLEGAFAHWDDAGHAEVVTTGGSQRITAGRGIVHAEMPAGPGPARGLQLWINLPRRLKGIPPDYQTVPASALPQEERGEARVRHVVGGGSPILLHTEVSYLDVTLRGHLAWRVPAGWNGFAYVVEGCVRIDAVEPGEIAEAIGPSSVGAGDGAGATASGGAACVSAGHALVVGESGAAAGAEATLALSPNGSGEARLALVSGRPHREPIRPWGPYVL